MRGERAKWGWALSPCARGREAEAPAPAAPVVVEEEGVAETGPLDTTVHRGKHAHNGLMEH